MKIEKVSVILIAAVFTLSGCSGSDKQAQSILPRQAPDVEEYRIEDDSVASISVILGERRTPSSAYGWHILELPEGVPPELVEGAEQFIDTADEQGGDNAETEDNTETEDNAETEENEGAASDEQEVEQEIEPVVDITVDPETGERRTEKEIKKIKKEQEKAEKAAKKAQEKENKAQLKQAEKETKAEEKKLKALQKEFDKHRKKMSDEEIAAEDAAISRAIETAASLSLTYSYNVPEMAAEDIAEYYDYLVNEDGFTAVEPFDDKIPAGYIMLSKPSAKTGYLFKMDIDYTWNDYVIRIYQEEAPPEEAAAMEAEESGEKRFYKSREKAIDALRNTPSSVLGIPEDEEGYTYIANPGRSKIEGKDAFGINVYKTREGGGNYIIGTFFLPIDKSGIYRYDIAQDTTTLVSGPVFDEDDMKKEASETRRVKTALERAVETYSQNMIESPLDNPVDSFIKVIPRSEISVSSS